MAIVTAEEKLELEALEAIFRTSKKTIQEYVREIERYCRFKSVQHMAINGTVMDDRSKLIDLYEACVQQDAHLAGVLETLESQIIGERYVLARQNSKGKYEKDIKESKKIQGTQFTKIIKGIVEAKLYGYTALEIMPDVDERTGRLKEVNIIERRNVLPDQCRIVKRSGIWLPGWDLNSHLYKDNYVLINSGSLGVFSATTPLILAKKFTFANYVNFSHTYGQPIIHGKTESENNQDRKKLANEIASAAQNKVIVTGLQDEVDIKTFTMSNSEHIFTGLMDTVNKEVSNLILGSESMAGAQQSYVGATKAHQDIYRDRVNSYRNYIENVMNEEIIPRLVKMGFISEGLEFKYSKQLEMSDQDRIDLYNILIDKYEVSPDEIEKDWGVVVGRQLNLESGGSGGVGTSGEGRNGPRVMSDEEYYKRYGRSRGAVTNFFDGETQVGNNAISQVFATQLPEKDEDREKKEFEALLVIFERFINSIDSEMEYWEIMEELMALRADFAIQYAIEGFGMDWEVALEIIRTSDISGLSDEDQNRREVLLAAIDNLVDFAVAEEYRMTLDMEEEIEDAEGDEEELEIARKVFKKYNSQYANVENSDIKYAMMVAAGIIFIPKSTSLMYMTQGDERVRPWHLQFEGFTAPKSDFPGWLVPPIEHQCRCYLVADGEVSGKMQDIQNAISIPEIPDWFNPTFKESVAFGGRIFSDEHPYFQIEEADIDKLQYIAESIKGKYLNG